MKSRFVRRLTIATLALASLIINDKLMMSPAHAQTTGGRWTFTGSLDNGRFGHTATSLQDGKVLVVGGGGFPCFGGGCYSTVNGTAELYDPAHGNWSLAGSLGQRRVGHTATLLPNGEVLVVGGFDYGYPHWSFAYVNSAEIYNPTTGGWRFTGNPGFSYVANSATLLTSGKVLVVFVSYPPIQDVTAKLYDPTTATWSSTQAPTDFGTVKTLFNGKVLSVSSNSSQLYDPTSGHWTSLAGFKIIGGIYTATLLNNGRVLITGNAPNTPTMHAELFDPASGTWSRTGDPQTPGGEVATLLPNGKVLVTGGAICSSVECHSMNAAELYDPTTGAWSATGNLNTPRFGHSATLLPNGRVLVAGGHEGDIYDFPTVSLSAEFYEPAISSTANPIDDPEYFVRQHYRDFLSREADAEGLAYWSNEIISCGGDIACVDNKRTHVSAAFFLSIEFQETGYLAYRMSKSAYGNLPNAPVPIKINEFLPDTASIGQGVVVNQAGWESVLENNKHAFALNFVQRDRFTSALPTSLTPEQFVDQLFMNAGFIPSAAERAEAINEFGSSTTTADPAARASALRLVAENATLKQQEFNRAFVLMQYFGYLRRNPNDSPEPGLNFDGYNFWLTKLNQFNGDYAAADMVKAFLIAGEYRQRFNQ